MSLLALFGPAGVPLPPQPTTLGAITRFTGVLGTTPAQAGRFVLGYAPVGVTVWQPAITKFTDVLGSPQAQPGRVMPGYYTTGIAVWKGPFACEVPPFSLDGKRGALRVGDQVTVPLGVALALAQSDPDWWELH